MKEEKYMFDGYSFIILENGIGREDSEILQDIISQQNGMAEILELPVEKLRKKKNFHFLLVDPNQSLS